MLKERSDAEFMTDENEPSEREERLAIVEEEILDISNDISVLQSEIEILEGEISLLEDKYEELMIESYELKYQ